MAQRPPSRSLPGLTRPDAPSRGSGAVRAWLDAVRRAAARRTGEGQCQYTATKSRSSAEKYRRAVRAKSSSFVEIGFAGSFDPS